MPSDRTIQGTELFATICQEFAERKSWA